MAKKALLSPPSNVKRLARSSQICKEVLKPYYGKLSFMD